MAQQTTRQQGARGRAELADKDQQAVRRHIQDEWIPKRVLVPTTRIETSADGTPCTVPILKRQRRQGSDPDAILRLLYGGEPTREQMAHAAAVTQQVVPLDCTEIVTELHQDNPERFFAALARYGPDLWLDSEVHAFIRGWWLRLLDPAEPEQRQQGAQRLLKRLGETLAQVGRGRTAEVTPDVARQLDAYYQQELRWCQRWRREERKFSHDKRKQSRHLIAVFQLPLQVVIETIQEGLHLKPSEWARQRVEAKTGFSEETVRQAVLEINRTKRV